MADELFEDDFNMIALPFTAVSGEDIDLNKDATFTGVIKAEEDGECDHLHIYINGEGYTFLYYHHDEETGKWHKEDGWYSTDDDPLEDVFPDGLLPVGTAMWFEALPGAERSEPLSVTFSGSVENHASISLEGITSGDFNMIANPYPVAWSPNDPTAVKFDNIIKAEEDGECDHLHVYINGEGYTFLYYHHDEETGKWHKEDGWYSTDDDPLEDVFPDGILPAGTAMWLEAIDVDRDGDLGVTFYSPLTK